jgi:8-oxo-dGTP diphosphatase
VVDSTDAVNEKHLVYCRIERGGAVLFLRRRQGVFLGGRWELPGGTVEPGEPHEVAATREVAEETGLRVRVDGERGRHTWMDVTGKAVKVHARIFNVTEERVIDVKLSADEHDEYAWVLPADTEALDLASHFRH